MDYDVSVLAADRFCKIYNKEIGCELCYETVQVSEGILKKKSVPELADIDTYEIKKQCCECWYYSTWEEDY